ncbi:MAG: hypothetical protein GX620_15005 [Chloroflexi bacterium]|nr:hypothetical protein [Chloroflexota bacterium]
MEVLFESRRDIVQIAGKVHAVQHPPKVSDEPVLGPDSPADGAGTTIYGSVLRDEGCYRMWYQAWPQDWNGEDTALVGYAESDDGWCWRKPRLGVVGYGNDLSNLCDLGLHSPSVFIDPEAPPSHRYRATGCCGPRHLGRNPAVSGAGYYTAHSADGLHWTLDSSDPTWRSADVITSIYHPGRRQGLVALKYSPRVRGIKRRSIWTAVLEGGRWSDPLTALIPDDFDDVCAVSRGYASGDYYGMAMLPACRSTIGFVWQFRHLLPRTPGSEIGVFGHVDVSLAYQPEPGGRWLHQAGRPDFISHALVPWGRGGIYTSSGPVEVRDEHWLYICGVTESHAWYLNERWQLLNGRREDLIRRGIGRIGVARWPKYRLFGLEADPTGYVDLDLGIIERDSELVLNYTTRAGGSITVELLGNHLTQPGGYLAVAPLSDFQTLEGHSRGEAIPLDSESVDQVVAWRGGAVLRGDAARAVTARLHLEQATVYAFDIRPMDPV